MLAHQICTMFCIVERMWIVLLISNQVKPAVGKHTVAGYSGLCGNIFKKFMLVLKSSVNWISDKNSVTNSASSYKSRKNPSFSDHRLKAILLPFMQSFNHRLIELKWEILHRRHKECNVVREPP